MRSLLDCLFNWNSTHAARKVGWPITTSMSVVILAYFGVGMHLISDFASPLAKFTRRQLFAGVTCPQMMFVLFSWIGMNRLFEFQKPTIDELSKGKGLVKPWKYVLMAGANPIVISVSMALPFIDYVCLAWLISRGRVE
jgi:hypothetical protein